MNWGDLYVFFISLPLAGWFVIFFILLIIAGSIFYILSIIKEKNIKLKNLEVVSNVQKEIYQDEGKNTLDNQCVNAHNLLKKIWIDIYETGRQIFAIKSKNELYLLEDIARLIESKINYEVKNDLTRNHIAQKNDLDLQKYSDAKALGYYRLVETCLYTYNEQLSKYHLPDIMKEITQERYKQIFSEVYFGARKIAGIKVVGD